MENAENPKTGEYHMNKDSEVDAVVKQLYEDKAISLKELIDDINDLIGKRKVLNADIFNSMDKLKLSLSNFMLSNASELSAKEKLDLMRKQIEVEEFVIQEKLNNWRDIAQLKKELREYAREFSEQEKRSDLLDSLME